MTYCFFENDGSLFEKRRVTFWKTTSHFLKTTGCFFTTDGSFLWILGECENLIEESTNEYREFHLWKYLYLPFLTRARVRAHYRSFRFFAVTSVTKFSQHTIFQNIRVWSRRILTNRLFKFPKFGGKNLKKCDFVFSSSPKFRLFWLRFLPLMWHLWQQKNNIAVGRRAHTRIGAHTLRACTHT